MIQDTKNEVHKANTSTCAQCVSRHWTLQAATGSSFVSRLQQCIMLIKKPHLSPKLGSESPSIIRAATGGTRLPGGPRLTDITLCLLFSFVVTQPNWEAEARRTTRPLWGRFWSRNATQLWAATYSTVIHCSWTAVCQLENMSGLSYLDHAVRYKRVFAQTFLTGDLLYLEKSKGSLDHSGMCLC